jgi:hypothetical protein
VCLGVYVDVGMLTDLCVSVCVCVYALGCVQVAVEEYLLAATAASFTIDPAVYERCARSPFFSCAAAACVGCVQLSSSTCILLL